MTNNFINALRFTLSIFIIVQCSYKTLSQNAIPTCLLPTINTATIIDLTPHELEPITAYDEIKKFTYNFSAQINSTKTISFNDTPILSIEAKAFCDSIFLKEWNSCRSAGTQTIIPALRFHYGLIKSLSKLTILFQPICLKLDTASAVSLTLSTSYECPNYYEYSSSNSSFSISPYAVEYKNAYKDCIRICDKALCKPDTCPFVSVFKECRDVESLIYTLYEIGSLIEDNTSKKINLYNAGFIESSMCIKGRVKHSIILAPEGIKTFLGFNNKFANLSHLCPPSCNKFIFKRAAATPNQLNTKQEQKPKSIWVIIMEVGELLIAILVGLLVFKSLHTGHRYLLYQTILALLVLLFCYYLTWYQKTHLLERNTHLVYNIAILFEIGFIYLYINHFFKSNIIRTVLIISYVFFLILYAFESFIIGYNKLHIYSYIFASVNILALTTRMIYSSFLSRTQFVLQNETFWICFGLVLYFIVSTPYLSIIHYLIEKKIEYNEMLYFVIINLLALFRYIFLAIGFFIVYKNKKTDS